MSLMSPCGLQQRSPRRSSANSDGYSEFEEIEAPPISSALSSLISTEHGGDLPSPVNRLRFSEKVGLALACFGNNHAHLNFFFRLMTFTQWSALRHSDPQATTKVTGPSGTQRCLLRKEEGL